MAWKGCEIYYHKDNFETQAELTDNKLRFAGQDKEAMMDRIKQIVCIDSGDPLETLNSLPDAFAAHGENVQTSPAVYMASDFKSDKLSLEERFNQLFMHNEYA